MQRRDHRGMTPAQRVHRESADAVDEAVAAVVLDPCTLAAYPPTVEAGGRDELQELRVEVARCVPVGIAHGFGKQVLE